MFKKYLDKAKSTIEDLDQSLRAPPSKSKKLVEYDSSYFNFSLEGGPLHTSRLQAVAVVRAGDRAGDMVPLNCVWFISTIDDKMKEIEGFGGPLYQPCTEDVGARISVQVTPVLDGVYTGMPVYGEVGPIVLDSAVEDKVLARLKDDSCEFSVVIDDMKFEDANKPASFPVTGIITLNKKEKLIEIHLAAAEGKGVKLGSCVQSERYPSVEILRRTLTQFELQFSATEAFSLNTSSNIDRDVIAMAIRMFSSDDLQIQLEEMNEDTKAKGRKRGGSSNLEALMKRERLIKQTKQLEKDNESLTKELEAEKEAKAALEVQVADNSKQIQENIGYIDHLQKEIERYKAEKDGLDGEKVFLFQEVNLYKAQILELEETIKNLENPPVPSKESVGKASAGPDQEEIINELKAKIARYELEIEAVQQEKVEAERKAVDLSQELEGRDSAINALKKRIQSLVQENEKVSSAVRTPEVRSPSLSFRSASRDPSLTKLPSESAEQLSPLNRANELSVKVSFERESSIDQAPKSSLHEDEIKQLRQANELLTASLETMKIVKESPSKKKNGLLDLIAVKSTKEAENVEYMQKLVNTLTEAIAEKDLAHENQKTVNKNLVRKIAELEQKLANK